MLHVNTNFRVNQSTGSKKEDFCVAKTKALISFAVTAQLICAFVFANAKIRFSQNEAHSS